MSSTTARPAAGLPRPAAPTRLARLWLGGWWHLALLVTNVLTATGAMILSALTLAAVVSIPGGGVGLILIIPMLWASQLLGRAERHRVVALTGADIPPPVRDPEQPLWRRLWLDAISWRAVSYFALHSLWGMIIGLLTLLGLSQVVAILALPLYRSQVPEEGLTVLDMLHVRSAGGQVALWVLALLALLAAPVVAGYVTKVDVTMARWLLGRDRGREVEQLTARVDTLTETRLQTIDSVEAERQRIERDLHDGPQQRLVAIAMSLGLAKEAMHDDPDAAAVLIEEAHASSKEAIVEMRNVARGIVPPVLADRGLDAAVSALAARSPVPVSVTAKDVGRLSPTLEAIAYFVVSESLTNVAKHSGATRAEVVLEQVGVTGAQGASVAPTTPGGLPAPGPELRVTVRDDGQGGADPARGTGLTGLRHRVGAVDGTLEVTSPPGGPTTLVARLPLRAAPPAHPAPPTATAPRASAPTAPLPAQPTAPLPTTPPSTGAPS